MMFALGCIQALECHANTCPTGVATQDPRLTKGLVPEEKSIRVARFQHETVKSAMDLMASAGIDHPDKVDRSVVSTRINLGKTQTFEETYPEIKTGSLLDGSTVSNDLFKAWKRASVESF
jgi:tetraacyldisaccharide-1-P 4'-kinase